MSIITIRNLTKTFRRFEKEAGLAGSVKSLFNRKFVEKTAVADFDMTVEPGEFLGLIGPNGAGKTTLVKMMTGIIAPTSGEIDVLGHYPNKLEPAFKRKYAVVMGQKSQLFFELTPTDTFGLFKQLYNTADEPFRRNVAYFTELFGVKELLNVQVRTLSLGERMKMELICALLHDPAVLFLDEPTIGLDAVAQKGMRAFLREVNGEKGTTIILTSHYMEDVRSLCARSVVINGGKKAYDGGTKELFDKYQTHRIATVTFEGEGGFKSPPGSVVTESRDNKVVLMIPSDKVGESLSFVMAGNKVTDLSVGEDDIGAVVERIYKAGEGA